MSIFDRTETGSPSPSPVNHHRADLALPILVSYEVLTGRTLLSRAYGESVTEYALRVYEAPFVLLAHDGREDPHFIYANRSAQRLFEYPWSTLVGLPSRHSAEADEQAERARLLSRVMVEGFCDDYAGIRIAASGRRFQIRSATVWNVLDREGRRVGQAATFAEWSDITH